MTDLDMRRRVYTQNLLLLVLTRSQPGQPGLESRRSRRRSSSDVIILPKDEAKVESHVPLGHPSERSKSAPPQVSKRSPCLTHN
jgi:hypothetical protein